MSFLKQFETVVFNYLQTSSIRVMKQINVINPVRKDIFKVQFIAVINLSKCRIFFLFGKLIIFSRVMAGDDLICFFPDYQYHYTMRGDKGNNLMQKSSFSLTCCVFSSIAFQMIYSISPLSQNTSTY